MLIRHWIMRLHDLMHDVMAAGGLASGLRAFLFNSAAERVMCRLRVRLFTKISGGKQVSQTGLGRIWKNGKYHSDKHGIEDMIHCMLIRH
jgi:hypothetical protein